MGALFAVAANNVPTGLVDFFHGLQVAIMFGLMTNITQFAWWTVRRKAKAYASRNRGGPRLTHWGIYGPVYIILFASVLVLTQPVCMLVIGSWNLPNFFFDGGDMGAPCTDATTKWSADYASVIGACASASCASTMHYDCDDATGVCNPTTCDFAANETAKAAALSCACGMDSGALVPNTSIGWVIQTCGTYLGFLLMFIGVFQATGLHSKIAKKWRIIRRLGGRRKKLPSGDSDTSSALDGTPSISDAAAWTSSYVKQRSQRLGAGNVPAPSAEEEEEDCAT